MTKNKIKPIALVIICLMVAAVVAMVFTTARKGSLDGIQLEQSVPVTSNSQDTRNFLDMKSLEALIANAHPSRETPSSGATTGDQVTSTVELPAEDNSWELTYEELAPLMEEGSDAAAKRLYEDTYRCLEYQMLPTIISLETHASRAPSESSDSELRKYASKLDHLEKETNELSAMCSSTDSARLKQVFPEILQKAAQLGVQGAGTCYVSGHFFPHKQSPAGLELLSGYEDSAGRIIRSALAGGDWRMLQLLTHASDQESNYQSSWVPSFLGNDSKIIYGLNRLELIGASGQEASKIQSKLQEMILQRGLSQQDIMSMDGWAQQMYSEYFKDTPRGDLSGGVCVIDGSN